MCPVSIFIYVCVCIWQDCSFHTHNCAKNSVLKICYFWIQYMLTESKFCVEFNKTIENAKKFQFPKLLGIYWKKVKKVGMWKNNFFNFSKKKFYFFQKRSFNCNFKTFFIFFSTIKFDWDMNFWSFVVSKWRKIERTILKFTGIFKNVFYHFKLTLFG